MARLPTPGGDSNVWGSILNEFLEVEHNTDGTLKASGSLSDKADDSAVVHISGDQTIAGVKTFSSLPIIPATPTTPTQAASKSYVDGLALSGTPDADATTKGKLRLANDLSGTADAPAIAAGAVTAAKIANTTITDAQISASAAISQSKIANLTSDLSGKTDKSTLTAKGDLYAATASGTITRLGVGSNDQVLTADSTQATGLKWAAATSTDTGAVHKGDLVINVQDYGAVGDGSTDDTTAINAAYAAASAGTTVWFPTPSSHYRITAQLTPPAGVASIGSGYGCEIRQYTQYKPVFDLFNVDKCEVRGFTLTLNGGPLSSPGSSFRGDNGMNYCAGVWTNGSYHSISELRIIDFGIGVYFSSTNGTSLTTTMRHGNNVHDVEISGVNFGVLFIAQTGLRLRNIYAHDFVDSSGGINPNHTIYATGGSPSGATSADIVVSDCVTRNLTFGCAYQFKYVTGLVVTNMLANNCEGLFNGIDINDAVLTNFASYGDTTSGTSAWSWTLTRVISQSTRVTMSDIQIHMASDGFPMLVIGDRTRVSNVSIVSNHTGANTNLYDLQLRGTDVVVDGLRIRNVGSAQYKGVYVGAPGYTTGDVTITNLECTNTRNLVDFDSVITGTNVVDYAPGLQRNILAGATNYIDQAGGTASFAISRREWTNTYTISSGSTATPRPPLETVSRFNVTDTTGFTVAAPVCRPKTGMVQEIIIVNSSGGTLGTITWNAIFALRTTFVAPTAGEAHRITFAYDGTNWREIARSMNAGIATAVATVTGLTGATTQSRFVGGTAAGAPASGTFAVNDYVISTDGNMYICTAAGTPGTWVALGTPAALSALAADAPTAGEIVPRRDQILSNAVAATSGTLVLTYFTADKTESITSLTVWTGTTAAAATPTLCRLGIYSVDGSGNLTLEASTPNDTTLFSATNTAYTKALSSTFNKVVGQRYATAVLVVSSAATPTWHGLQLPGTNPANAFVRVNPAIIGRLTGQTDLPASVTAGSLIGYQAMVAMQLT